MEVSIKWSPRAAVHLTDICNYIAEDSKVYARIFSRKVLELIKETSRFPQSGRMVSEYQDKNLRERKSSGMKWGSTVESIGFPRAHFICGAGIIRSQQEAKKKIYKNKIYR